MRGSPNGVTDKLTYAGIFLVAMATLMLEVLLTRITSVSAWYHLAFFVISLGMLGMTAGAVLVFVAPKLFERALVPARLAQASLGFALLTPISVSFALSMPLSSVTDLMSFVALLGVGATLAGPFILAGVALALALTRSGLAANVAYGVDLVGAAAGCILILPLLDSVDAPSAALIAAAVGGLGACAFAVAARRSLAPAALCSAALVLCGMWNASSHPQALRPAWVKGVREEPRQLPYIGWNTYSRVSVGLTFTLEPAFWARSPLTPPEVLQPNEQRMIQIDGGAGTWMTRIGNSMVGHRYLDWDITAFAHRVRSTGPAAVIGVGGGRDVLEAARVGHQPVVGVELNDLIVKLHTSVMRDFSGLTNVAGVELVHDEARSYMAREQRKFTVLTMSLIDTWASTGAGAYSLSENGLYTREAWQLFLRRLTNDGIFTVSRWYLVNSPGETARMLALAFETLYAEGVQDPHAHVALLQTGHVATLLVAKNPFSAADLERIDNEALRMGFNTLFAPKHPPVHPLLKELTDQSSREALWQWSSQQQLDITPPTDARPFFFSMLKPRTWLQQRDTVDSLDLSFLGNLQATQTLVYATVVCALLTVLTIVGPMLARRRDFPALGRSHVLASAGYFALIGLGFMYVEMGMLSRLNVFLGRPTLALCVLLASMILFTGIGSMCSGHPLFERRPLSVFYPWLPAALIVANAGLLPASMHQFEGADTGVRALVSVLLIAPTAFGLGLGFPLGLRLCERMEARVLGSSDREHHGAALGPWLWGINGACGVCASGLALGTSMVFGIDVTLLVGAACYALLPLCTTHLERAAR
jgi:spermidine synthase